MVFATSFEPRGNQALSDHRPPNILISYAYAAQFARVEYTPPFLMIDSGAFSAWQAGRPTDLHLVDATTANLVVQIYDAINEPNRVLFRTKWLRGTMKRCVDLCWKLTRKS